MIIHCGANDMDNSKQLDVTTGTTKMASRLLKENGKIKIVVTGLLP